jgi:CheY-like chemotaxis protein
MACQGADKLCNLPQRIGGHTFTRIITRLMQRIFIRVTGFTNVERHALNTMFRLSQDPKSGRAISYEPWIEGYPDPPSMALVDGASGGAAQELSELHHEPDVGLIWVGMVTPVKAWRTFQRPLRWPDVLTALDMYFDRSTIGLDFDLGSDDLPAQIDAATQPASLFGMGDILPTQRALVVDADAPGRFLLRSALAANNMTQVDEAGSVQEALDLLAQHRYSFVSVDLALQGQDPWMVIAAAASASVRLVTADKLTMAMQLLAKMNGCVALQKPLPADKLAQLIAGA